MPEIDQDDEAFQRAAAQLIGGLFVLVKLALVHRMDNAAVGPAIARFHETLGPMHEAVGGSAALQFVADAVYVNQRLVHADLSTWERARFLRAFFARMEIGEIGFDGEVAPETLRDFLQGVREAALDPSIAATVQQRAFRGLTFRKLDAIGAAGGDAVVVPDKVRVLRAYGVLVVTMRELLEAIGAGQRPPVIPVRRAMQDFARLPETSRSLQLGLLSLPQLREELASRLAGIGILVAMVAKRLGHRAAEVRDLGVAGALAGLGRAARNDLHAAAPESIAGAYLEGARWLLPSAGVGRPTSLRVIAALEQCWPQGRVSGHPVSRLVAAAELYLIWTTPRPAGPGLDPAAAMHRLLEQCGVAVDRKAVRALVSTLGLFPVGSTVRLTSGETAVVVDVAEDPRFVASPRVRIVAAADGSPGGGIKDLAGTGITVAGTVEAAEMDLNVGHFLFA